MALFSVTPRPCQHLLDLHWLHLPLTVHCWQAVFIPTNSSAPAWTRGAVPVALCTDVGVWHMVALVLRAGNFIHCQCPDVSRDAHSLPPEIEAVWCTEHLKLSIVWAVKGCKAGVGVEDAGGRHQVQNNDFQIMSRAASRRSTARPHYHMKCHRRALSFSPSDCFP